MRRAAVCPLIRFFYEGVSGWRLPAARRHKAWLRACLRALPSAPPVGRLYYTFLSVEAITALHERYLGDPSPTDVISFPYEEEGLIEGEIFVAPQVVKAFAAAYGEAADQALRRTLVHGLLHLLGWADDTPARQQEMHQQEELCLRLWETLKEVSHETPTGL